MDVEPGQALSSMSSGTANPAFGIGARRATEFDHRAFWAVRWD
jgi:hypothetical protein